MDSYDWFVGLVEERRPLSRAEVLAVADGSIFTGRQALERKLVDELGGEEQAVEWLATKGVDGELSVDRVEVVGKRQLLLAAGARHKLAGQLCSASRGSVDDVCSQDRRRPLVP
jgi:ClpP class serine protease